MKTVPFTQGYQAAHNSAVVVNRSTLGMLKITGETRTDLIHRMSTQKLTGMQSGEGRATVLTSDIGRMIDRLILYAGSDKVYVLTGEDNSDAVARYLMRFVFFRDDFQLEDLSKWVAVWGIYGAKSAELLTEMGWISAELPLHHYHKLPIGTDAYLHRTDAIAGDGYFVICNSADNDTILAALAAANLPLVDSDTYHYLRIESGLAAFGHELTLDYNPLEADLWADVSFNKGCYTGQEIIARLDSRGKLAKKLVRISAESPIETGLVLTANGKKAGTITSTATSSAGTVALAYIKTKYLSEVELFSAEIPLTLHS